MFFFKKGINKFYVVNFRFLGPGNELPVLFLPLFFAFSEPIKLNGLIFTVFLLGFFPFSVSLASFFKVFGSFGLSPINMVTHGGIFDN